MRMITRIANLFRRSRLDREIEAELRSHVEMRAADNVAAGMSPERAADAAHRALGNPLKIEEDVRATWGFRWLETLVQDVRYGVRQLRRNPGFTAVAVLTLALGIGANTAIFSIVDAVLLRPLPFKEPSKLVMLNEGLKSLGYPDMPASAPDIGVIERTQQSFTSVGAFQNEDFDLSSGGEPERVTAARLSASIFPMLEIRPLLGRTYIEQEDKPGTHVAVLSYGLWQHRYAGRATIIGQTIELDRIPYTVIGVMPKNFRFPLPGPKYNNRPAELWIPMAFTSDELQSFAYSDSVLARLRPSVTFNQAQADAALLAAQVKRVYPPELVKAFGGVTPTIRLTPLHQAVAGPVETLLLVLMTAVGFILLIACANVATLLLSRAASRSKEIAIRTALGATRMRLIRQMLTENLILALAGGALGILIAFWGTSALLSLVPSSLALPHSATLGGWVLAFVATTSCLTAVVFGVAPAFQASTVHVQGSLRESGRSGTPSRDRRRLQGIFVVAEFALAMILLIGAGLLIRSFSKLLETSPGFRPDHVLTMSVPLPLAGYSKATEVRQFYQQAIERIASLPGVKSVAASNGLPLEASDINDVLQVEGHPGSTPGMAVTWALGDYFSTMGIPLIEGRFFTPEDRIGSQAVAIVSEETAKLLWPDEDALGKRLGHPNMMRTVVGIVGDVNDGPLGSKPGPHFYLPYPQLPDGYFTNVTGVAARSMDILMRTSGDPSSLTSAVVAQIRSLDPQLPVANIRTMDQEVTSSVAAPKFNTFVLGLFAFLALFLAAIGIYGVLAYAVAQRTHEVGIRMALGAQRGDVMRLVLGQGARLALAGLAIGSLAALGLTRMMSSLLYGISPTDPLTFAAVAVVLLAVSLLACYVPARRAMKVDPMVALRYE